MLSRTANARREINTNGLSEARKIAPKIIAAARPQQHDHLGVVFSSAGVQLSLSTSREGVSSLQRCRLSLGDAAV